MTPKGGRRAVGGPPQKIEVKKHRFFWHDNIKGFTRFTLQPKSAGD